MKLQASGSKQGTSAENPGIKIPRRGSRRENSISNDLAMEFTKISPNDLLIRTNDFKNKSNEELVAAYKRELGNTGWVSRRADYLHELRTEMQSRLYCSSLINETGGFYLAAANVWLEGDKVHRVPLVHGSY